MLSRSSGIPSSFIKGTRSYWGPRLRSQRLPPRIFSTIHVITMLSRISCCIAFVVYVIIKWLRNVGSQSSRRLLFLWHLHLNVYDLIISLLCRKHTRFTTVNCRSNMKDEEWSLWNQHISLCFISAWIYTSIPRLNTMVRHGAGCFRSRKIKHA
jgi:hypothetical protein